MFKCYFDMGCEVTFGNAGRSSSNVSLRCVLIEQSIAFHWGCAHLIHLSFNRDVDLGVESLA